MELTVRMNKNAPSDANEWHLSGFSAEDLVIDVSCADDDVKEIFICEESTSDVLEEDTTSHLTNSDLF